MYKKGHITVFNSSTSHHNSFLMETLTKSSLLKLIKKTSFTLCSKAFQDVMTMREKQYILCSKMSDNRNLFEGSRI